MLKPAQLLYAPSASLRKALPVTVELPGCFTKLTASMLKALRSFTGSAAQQKFAQNSAMRKLLRIGHPEVRQLVGESLLERDTRLGARNSTSVIRMSSMEKLPASHSREANRR